jgi:hypothetical protein
MKVSWIYFSLLSGALWSDGRLARPWAAMRPGGDARLSTGKRGHDLAREFRMALAIAHSTNPGNS